MGLDMVRGGGAGGGWGGGGNPRFEGDHKDHRSGRGSGGNQRLGLPETMEEDGCALVANRECCLKGKVDFILVLHCGLGLSAAAVFAGCLFPIFFFFFFVLFFPLGKKFLFCHLFLFQILRHMHFNLLL